jgi:hypothetical protein
LRGPDCTMPDAIRRLQTPEDMRAFCAYAGALLMGKLIPRGQRGPVGEDGYTARRAVPQGLLMELLDTKSERHAKQVADLWEPWVDDGNIEKCMESLPFTERQNSQPLHQDCIGVYSFSERLNCGSLLPIKEQETIRAAAPPSIQVLELVTALEWDEWERTA